eukprot:TRINITY_DN260_c0_g1_i9.p1 TRINITY_DN260_c0_g1~~TRINITY_DN260_c0_g1_i9.p1  ORF type:complete len:1100 (+),score=195.02 TRINITY_DN260_c0_g1_i9:55-3354(+)
MANSNSRALIVFSIALWLLPGVLGHGALTKPIPRMIKQHEYCPWCVGEHQPLTNPYGSVHHDAVLSDPCGGSKRGDPPYPKNNYGSKYTMFAEQGQATFSAGGILNATIVLDADHNGEAKWSYCPHTEDETEECFRSHELTDWVDVHSYWGGDSSIDHWKSGSTFPQEVSLPADMPSGPVTLRWLWICKWTDEIFVSCLDTDIVGGPSVPSTSPVITTTATSSSGISSNGDEVCIWTEPAGRRVTRTEQNRKDGRVCWDFAVEGGATVYYKSKSDIYTHWNADACCVSAAGDYGSKAGGPSNIVSFTPPSHGTFGFCECTAWDPSDPGTSCAGQATAENMVCPVMGASAEMCSGDGAEMGAPGSLLDGIPVECSPVQESTTAGVPGAITFSTGRAGSSLQRLQEFVTELTDQPVPDSQARAVHSSGGAAGGVVSEGQAYGLLLAGGVLASMSSDDPSRSWVSDLVYSFFLGWRRMCERSVGGASCQQGGYQCGGEKYPCLPHWKFDDDLTTVIGTGAAPDGDADAITGMILAVLAVEEDASRPGWYAEMGEWAYDTCLQFYESSTLDSSSGKHRIVKLGSCWGGWGGSGQNPSYHAPAVYRMCKHYMKSHDSSFGASDMAGDLYEEKWVRVIDTSYKVYESVQCASTGLITNWARVYESADGQALTASTGFSGSGTPGAEYGSEASRGVWRVALDYIFFPEEAAGSASSFLSRVAEHLESKESGGNWAENLNIDASCLVNSIHSSWSWNMFMAGPTFASLVCPSAMTSSRQQAVIDAAGDRLQSRSIEGYYSGSWLAIATMTLNGDLTKAASRLQFRTSVPPGPSTSSTSTTARTSPPSSTSLPTPPPPSTTARTLPPSSTPVSSSGCCTWDLAQGCQQQDNTYCQVQANCEGSCNGNWLVQDQTTTTAERTTQSSTAASSAAPTTTTTLSTTTTSAVQSSTTSTTSLAVHGSCGQLHEQCGGQEHKGPQCCVSGLKCQRIDAFYSQCQVDPDSTYSCGQLHEQCGGQDWSGSTCCAEGLVCVWGNDYFSQCLQQPGSLIQQGVRVIRDAGMSNLRGPRSRKSGRATVGTLESRPLFVQRSSTLTLQEEEAEGEEEAEL